MDQEEKQGGSTCGRKKRKRNLGEKETQGEKQGGIRARQQWFA